ncbi:osmotically inducible protein C [Polymorphobacter glacialis]|uniref:Osmotically inducible protein C n=1 Tax=Sandarakinorhabdus glacialis TaxID=1614636 RepID=A0A917E7S4_9SPHN|nr:bifunctional alpha/beta hydrolase/OsmC family protein [Polymorphobacter glacialis]GGE07584.1 osmotically inducible protein C [Polymorphobacter glacialis]
MPTRPFTFANAAGQQLSGRLELPVGRARAWAVFAHCFTCGKDNLAAVRIARGLAGAGIGVLRFDFAGLGDSDGDFVDSGFGLNVDDLVAAAGAMAAAGMPPTLLVGHSLGGAAALAAAGHLPDIRAVAVIAAPFDVANVLHQLSPAAIADIERSGSAGVTLGGRPFTIGRKFIEDVRHQDQRGRIAALGRPLLILHAPGDAVVGIDAATGIYLAAHHPKSFVSLEGADHLLSRARDAEFVADMIGVWAGRYLGEPASDDASAFDAEAEETGASRFDVAMRAGTADFIADEPESMGGLGAGATPYDLLCAALAACSTMTLRMYAEKKGWPIGRIRTGVAHRYEAGTAQPDVLVRQITIEGDIDDEQRAALGRVADRCPVHRILEQGTRFDSVDVRAAHMADAGTLVLPGN